MDYHRIKTILGRTIKNPIPPQLYERPYIPALLEILQKSKKGAKNFYLAQIQSDTAHDNFGADKLKWDKIMKDGITLQTLEVAYKICFNTVEDNNVKWFQYRVLNGILGTRYRLYKLYY